MIQVSAPHLRSSELRGSRQSVIPVSMTPTLDHTSDIVIAVRGANLRALFSRALEQMGGDAAREALLDPLGAPKMVKQAALMMGFLGSGRFAHDYKAMFGELPSTTLARANACRASCS